MSEKTTENNAVPEAQNDFADFEVTTPKENSEIIVPVKFNKQIVNLNLQQAQELAQKGMKFDMISSDYSALKSLANEEGKNVSEYVARLVSDKKAQRLQEITDKCGGDSEFAERIVNLEKGGEQLRGFDEVKENFPKIKAIEDLPQSVIDAASLKGTLLLDEYLRYLHSQDLAVKQRLQKPKETLEASTGSFTNKSGAQSPETAEFLRGLWQK